MLETRNMLLTEETAQRDASWLSNSDLSLGREKFSCSPIVFR